MQQTSSMPGMRQSHTLLTTRPSTALQSRSFAAAAKTWGMLAMRACHLSFSIAHPKHCSAGASCLNHRHARNLKSPAECLHTCDNNRSRRALPRTATEAVGTATRSCTGRVGRISGHLNAYHGRSNSHSVVQRCCEPGVHATQAEACHAYSGAVHIRPRIQVVQQHDNIPNVVQQEGVLWPFPPGPASAFASTVHFTVAPHYSREILCQQQRPADTRRLTACDSLGRGN